MIALIASALLGLYVFVPYIVFHRLSSLFIRLKKFQRTKTEEVVAGIIVAGLPFIATLFIFRIGAIGGCCVPLPLADSHAQKTSDYHIVFDAAYSDHYFTDHEQATWDALDRVYKRQADFLTWNYIFLLFETAAFILLTRYYGDLRRFRPYAPFAAHVLLPAVSEWHILLTDFTFPRRERRSVKADVMSKDDTLYRGDIAEYFLDSSGDLSGLLIKNPERYQYEKLKEDRKNNVQKDPEEYWKTIPGGGNFYLPNSNIASVATAPEKLRNANLTHQSHPPQLCHPERSREPPTGRQAAEGRNSTAHGASRGGIQYDGSPSGAEGINPRYIFRPRQSGSS